MFVLDKSDVWSNIHKDDESPKEELPKDKESLKDDKSSKDKQLRKNEKPVEQKDLQKTDGSPKDDKLQKDEKLPNEEELRKVKHKQELTENSDADSDELFVLDKADVWSDNDTGNTRRSSRKRKKTIDYKGMELEHDGLETFGDPDFIPFEDELQVDAVVNPDDALERAIAKMNELCAQFEKEDEYRASSPVDEMLIKNDSAIGLGSSIGEIIDTSADEQEISIREEEQDIGQIQDKNNENHERNIEKQRENDEKQGAGAEKQGAVAERKDDEDGKKKKKKKPKRPCPYGCVRKQSVLSRHLKLQHKDEPAIIQILAKPKELQNKLFDNLKKEGIFKYNQKEMLKDNPCYMRERRSKDSAKIITANDIVVCSECKGTYSKSFKARHQIECGKTGGKVMIPMIPVKDMIVTEYPADFKDVINKMKLDEISKLAKTDQYILIVGARIFNGNKCKSEKMQEVETRVRSHMRLLSRLLLKFIESLGIATDLRSMFDRTNMKHLRYAIESLTETEANEQKSGLKVQIQNVIKLAAKTLEAHFLIEGDNNSSIMICEFVKVFHLVENELFNGALYKIKQKRNKSTRRPENLPDEEIVQDLKKYLLDVMLKENFIFNPPSNEYVQVRDATCARLTMFNGRRGGEPARLFTYQWKEALEGLWLRPKVREQYKREVKTKNRITYQEGKGDKQVCVFFPPDTVDAMIFLCDEKVRVEAGVSKLNKFAFPSTGNSLLHTDGWAALTTCCKKAGIDSKINGTLNRHRVSSIMGALDMSEKDRNLSYEHFGHSEEMNKYVYQIPQAEQQLARTGEFLALIDNNHNPFENIDQPADINQPSGVVPTPDIVLSSSEIGKPSDSFSTFNSKSENEKNGHKEIGTKRQRKRKTKVESDPCDSDEDDPVQTNRSFKWSERLIEAFDKSFQGYVERKEKKKMPSVEEMKEFMKSNGEDERLFGKVKIRINNARSAVKSRAAKRAKAMGLEK
uniref:Uncharacterized protein n=2 Tax=Clytia hemisphaerica TaxID=252671 RepID=A0A7M5UR60_9CNID